MQFLLSKVRWTTRGENFSQDRCVHTELKQKLSLKLTLEKVSGCSKSFPPTSLNPQGPGPCITTCRGIANVGTVVCWQSVLRVWRGSSIHGADGNCDKRQGSLRLATRVLLAGEDSGYTERIDWEATLIRGNTKIVYFHEGSLWNCPKPLHWLGPASDVWDILLELFEKSTIKTNHTESYCISDDSSNNTINQK